MPCRWELACKRARSRCTSRARQSGVRCSRRARSPVDAAGGERTRGGVHAVEGRRACEPHLSFVSQTPLAPTAAASGSGTSSVGSCGRRGWPRVASCGVQVWPSLDQLPATSAFRVQAAPARRCRRCTRPTHTVSRSLLHRTSPSLAHLWSHVHPRLWNQEGAGACRWSASGRWGPSTGIACVGELGLHVGVLVAQCRGASRRRAPPAVRRTVDAARSSGHHVGVRRGAGVAVGVADLPGVHTERHPLAFARCTPVRSGTDLKSVGRRRRSRRLGSRPRVQVRRGRALGASIARRPLRAGRAACAVSLHTCRGAVGVTLSAAARKALRLTRRTGTRSAVADVHGVASASRTLRRGQPRSGRRGAAGA